MSWSPALPAWLSGLCRWWPASKGKELTAIYLNRGLGPPRLRSRSPSSSWCMMHSAHIPAAILESSRRSLRVQFGLPWLRPPVSLSKRPALLVNAIAPEASLMPLLFGTHWYFLGSCVDWLCVGGAPITAGVMRACCCRQLLRFFAWWCRLPVELCL
jgi:hypothetical protein